MTSAVAYIYQHLVDTDQLDELGFVSEADLRLRFPTLSYEEQSLLFLNIQSTANETHSAYNWRICDPQAMHNMIGEAEHQGFDGWDADQQATIRAFLADIAFAVSQS